MAKAPAVSMRGIAGNLGSASIFERDEYNSARQPGEVPMKRLLAAAAAFAFSAFSADIMMRKSPARLLGLAS